MRLTKQEIIHLLTEVELGKLLAMADKVRRENVGDIIHIRALLEFSNVCVRNCSYCGLNVCNTKLHRYTIPPDEIIEVARQAREVGYRTIVLQSGESTIDVDMLEKVVREISGTGMYVTLSCGELEHDEYVRLKKAGGNRYLLKHETSDAELYASYHDGYTLEDRLACARDIKSIGFEYGGGFLVGLHRDIEGLANDLLLLQDLNCDMLGIGTFIPHPDTPLAGKAMGDYELTLRCVAVARLLLPKANIPATTSLLQQMDFERIMCGGANVIMINVSPAEYRKSYEIYPKKYTQNTIKVARENIENKIIEIGRKPL